MTSKSETRTIELDQLARVEGESALRVRIEAGRATDVALAIFEPPRYFEALLAGRSCFEAPDIAARICGICPVAYQMSAVPEPLQALRRLLYCGEWIESHVLHVHMLHAPDFFNAEDAVELARAAPEVVTRALAMKKTGNALMALLGGREVHPINVRVGGFYRLPDRAALSAFVVWRGMAFIGDAVAHSILPGSVAGAAQPGAHRRTHSGQNRAEFPRSAPRFRPPGPPTRWIVAQISPAP